MYKIIFTGPVGSGKTTAIAAVSDIHPIKTDVAASDMTKVRKATTTVALDYGMVVVEGGVKIHLYGTPGQERFNFMWEILKTGGLGLIILLDNTRPDPFQDMRFFLESFRSFIEETGVAIGVTQMDLDDRFSIDDYYDQLKILKLNPPIFSVDARVKQDVSLLIQSLMYSIDPSSKTD
jgi:signal recognition particle receptor subunit beta